MRQTLSGHVFNCLPKTGSITAPEVCAKLKKIGVNRDVRSITGILWHLRDQECAIKVSRLANDDKKIVNRWARGKPYILEKKQRVLPPTFDDLLTAELLVKHWIPPLPEFRGTSPVAEHARKTHCAHGHPFDDVNTYFYRGSRYCRECTRIGQRNRYKSDLQERAR